MKRAPGWILLAVVCLSCLQPQAARAGTPAGISFGLGGGVFFAQNRERYMDIDVDVYPEMGGFVDVSGIQLGITAGLVYRKATTWFDYCDYGFCPNWRMEYTMMLIPIQGEIGIMPLRFFSQDAPVQPYFSVGGGAFVPTGDSDYRQTEACATAKLGAQASLMDMVVVYGDIRYTYADNELGGVIFTVGCRARIPLSR